MRPAVLRRAFLATSLLLAGAVPALAQGGDPSFSVVNRSGQTIEQLYVSSAQENSWGQDRLGRNTLSNGRSYAVRLPAGQCVNDIRVVYQGGRAEERRGVDTCPLNEVVFGTQGAPPQAQQGGKRGPAVAGPTGNPSFNLVNRSSKTIQVVRASPSSDSSWGEDRLGNEVVAPGATFAIRLPAGECNYDIRIEYEDQAAEERRGVNLCSVANVTFP